MSISRPKILAIDDNHDNLTIFKAVVADTLPEATVLCATSGAEGIALAAHESPDVIVLDIVMPGMDGFAVCKCLKEDSELQHIPVIFLTALRTDRSARIHALEAGAEAFLTKPIDEAELTAQIRAMAKIKEANELKLAEKVRLASLVSERTAELEQELARRRSAELELQKSQASMLSLLEELKAENEARKKSEAALQESEGRLSSIFRVAPTGIGITRERILLDVNMKICEMTDYTKEELIGKSARILYPAQAEFEHVGAEQLRQIELQGTGSIETRWAKKDGEPFDIILCATPIDSSDHSKGIIFTALDITELKRTEDERLKLQTQLIQSQKMEAIGQLAGGIAHDFNNILTAICGYNFMIQNSCNDNPASYSYTEEIASAVERATAITNRLLTFSRQEMQNKEFHNLNKIIANVQKMLCRLLGEDLDFRFIPCDDDLIVYADLVQMEQVLMNLATNARDAMTNGGTFSIQTGRLVGGENITSATGSCVCREYAVITVSDTGVGMDEITQQKIFDPFFTTKEVGKGTGLGLSVVYGILQQHDGYIKVFSTAEQGTTFQIFIPLAMEPEAAHLEIPAIAAKGGTETILVAEDDQQLRDLIQLALSSFGYKTIITANGEDALSKFRESAEDIDLLLLDIIMPKQNGIEVFHEARRIKPDIKALLMSGYPANFITDRGIVTKEVGYITKPVSPNSLLTAIRESLDDKPGRKVV